MAKVKLAIRAKGISRKEAWKSLDVSNDARIDRLEFQRWLLDDIGYAYAEQIDLVFQQVDADQDGVISPVEFKALFDEDSAADSGAPAEAPGTGASSAFLKQVGVQLGETFPSWKEAFEAINTSNSGCISKQELRAFLVKELGLENPQIVMGIFKELDTDGNGAISVQEFRSCFDVPVYCSSSGFSAESDEAGPRSSSPLRRRGSTLREEDAVQRRASTQSVQRRRSTTDCGTGSSNDVQRRASEPALGSEDQQASQSRGRRGLEQFRDFLKRRFAGAKEAFACIDKDNDRQLDREELKRVLADLQYPGDAEAVFVGLDANNDGFVTRDEFKQQLKLAMKQSRSSEPCAAAGA